jgi:hypothetical protein
MSKTNMIAMLFENPQTHFADYVLTGLKNDHHLFRRNDVSAGSKGNAKVILVFILNNSQNG